jgi:hypothetical protein
MLVEVLTGTRAEASMGSSGSAVLSKGVNTAFFEGGNQTLSEITNNNKVTHIAYKEFLTSSYP